MMAIILSHAERTRLLQDISAQVATLAMLSENVDQFVLGKIEQGTSASAITSDVVSLLAPLGTLRTNIATLLGQISIVHQVQVRIGMPHNYQGAVIQASDPAYNGHGTIRVPLAYSTYVNPFLSFQAGDDLTLSDAENPLNNGTFRLAITPNAAGGEMISNSGFASDSGWTEDPNPTANITITGGAAVFSSTTYDTLKQLRDDMVLPWVVGQYYLVRFSVSAYTAGAIQVGTNTIAHQFSAGALGAFEALILADGHSDGLVFTGDGASLSIDNVSMIPWTGLAFTGGLNANSANDRSLVITLSER